MVPSLLTPVLLLGSGTCLIKTKVSKGACPLLISSKVEGISCPTKLIQLFFGITTSFSQPLLVVTVYLLLAAFWRAQSASLLDLAKPMELACLISLEDKVSCLQVKCRWLQSALSSNRLHAVTLAVAEVKAPERLLRSAGQSKQEV